TPPLPPRRSMREQSVADPYAGIPAIPTFAPRGAKVGSGSGRLRQFRAEHLDPFNDRRRRKQVRRLRHQRLRDGPVEMGLPPGFIREGVEDAKRRWSKAQREPDRCGGLLPREFKALHQEGGDFRLLARFCFQTDEQTQFRFHFRFLSFNLISFRPAAQRRGQSETTRSSPCSLLAGLTTLILLLPCEYMCWFS